MKSNAISCVIIIIFNTGENFSGDLKRVTLKACVKEKETKQYNWMVKLSPTDPTRVVTANAFEIEQKEFAVYRDVIPGIR